MTVIFLPQVTNCFQLVAVCCYQQMVKMCIWDNNWAEKRAFISPSFTESHDVRHDVSSRSLLRVSFNVGLDMRKPIILYTSRNNNLNLDFLWHAAAGKGNEHFFRRHGKVGYIFSL